MRHWIHGGRVGIPKKPRRLGWQRRFHTRIISQRVMPVETTFLAAQLCPVHASLLVARLTGLCSFGGLTLVLDLSDRDSSFVVELERADHDNSVENQPEEVLFGQMPTLPALDVNAKANYSPHVVILGAGASVAACPYGDRRGRRLPLMANFVDVVGLGPLLETAGVSFDGEQNFELIYDQLACSPDLTELRIRLERAVRDYFTSLELPDCVTLYDQLLLSLRPKDIIASFNWDPFLLQACARNRLMRNLPKVVFLHGNVYLGYCPMHSAWGYSTQNCNTCGKRFEPSPLLFPIKTKDYRAHPLLARQWDQLSLHLEHAYMLTIFGYAAPSSDVAARDIMLKAWSANETRQLAQIEIVDVLPRRTLDKRWSDFIQGLHGGTIRRFCRTWQFQYPRRSCETLAFATLQQDPWATRKIPRFRRLDRLQQWIRPLIEEEDALEQNGAPLRPFEGHG